MKLLILLFPILCQAGGSLQSEVGYFRNADHVGGKLGISIHEKLFGALHYAQYTGAGYSPQMPETRMLWANSNHGLVYYFPKFSVGAGVSFLYGDENFRDGFRVWDLAYTVKASYKLW